MFQFAKKAHKWQKRASGEDYIVHPVAVAMNLTRLRADDVSIASAFLHDVVEDTKCTIETIEAEFWKEIAEIVDWVTKLWKVHYEDNMLDRDVESLRKLFISVSKDIRVMLVKICDRIHNIQTLEYQNKEQRKNKAKETLEIYVPIIYLLSLWEFIWEVEDMCFKYIDEESYNKIYENFWKKYTYYKTKIDTIKEKINDCFNSMWMNADVSWRIKSFYSIYQKMKSKNIPIEMIYDVLAFRIIVTSVQDCYNVLRIIHTLYKMKDDRFKDYISSPKNNWYQAIHTTVFDNDWDMVEFQILTKEMADLNQFWIAAHYIYKNYQTDFINIPDWIKNILDLQRWINDSEYFFDKVKNEVLSPHIQCYTPKWLQVELPKDSTILDFAYKVHSDMWNNFWWAYVNWIKIKDPIYILKNWDIVNILKSDKADSFLIEYISIVKTNKAREKLQKIFKKESKEKRIKLWKYLLNKRLEILWFRYFEDLPYKSQKLILKRFDVIDTSIFYDEIWSWHIDLDRITKLIFKLFETKTANKIVELKIVLKSINYKTVWDIITVFYNLNTKIDEISYTWLIIHIRFMVNNYLNFQSLFLELKRVPNVLTVGRKFPFRLALFNGLLLFFIWLVIVNPFLLIYLNNTFPWDTFLFRNMPYAITFLIMFLLVYIFKYITKITLPDILNQKIFWFYMFMLNTIILLTILWEVIYIRDYLNIILFLSLSIVMYAWVFFEYITTKLERSIN